MIDRDDYFNCNEQNQEYEKRKQLEKKLHCFSYNTKKKKLVFPIILNFYFSK